MLGQEREADLVTAAGGAPAILRSPARDTGHRSVTEDDGERGGVGADVAVQLQASSSRLGVSESGPHERADGRWIDAEPLEERKIRFAEGTQSELDVHAYVIPDAVPARVAITTPGRDPSG